MVVITPANCDRQFYTCSTYLLVACFAAPQLTELTEQRVALERWDAEPGKPLNRLPVHNLSFSSLPTTDEVCYLSFLGRGGCGHRVGVARDSPSQD
jgi:hypothetical protein